MSLRDSIIEKMEETPTDAGGVRRLWDMEYEALADAALAALRPHDAVAGAKPLILYFKTDADRDEMIAACREALPNARAVKV